MEQKNNDKLKLNVKKVCNKIKEKMQEHFDFVCQDLFSGICTITFKPNNLTLKKELVKAPYFILSYSFLLRRYYPKKLFL